MSTIPMYLTMGLMSASGTVCGILYWMAMENMREKKYKVIHVFLLSLFLTPIGAWIVSAIYRFVEISNSSRSQG